MGLQPVVDLSGTTLADAHAFGLSFAALAFYEVPLPTARTPIVRSISVSAIHAAVPLALVLFFLRRDVAGD